MNAFESINMNFVDADEDQGICDTSKCLLTQAVIRPCEESSSGSQSATVVFGVNTLC